MLVLDREGQGVERSATSLPAHRVISRMWPGIARRGRYVEPVLQGIEPDLLHGAPPVKVHVHDLVEYGAQSKPPAAAHCSTRKMVAVLGIGAIAIMRHCKANRRGGHRRTGRPSQPSPHAVHLDQARA